MAENNEKMPWEMDFSFQTSVVEPIKAKAKSVKEQIEAAMPWNKDYSYKPPINLSTEPAKPLPKTEGPFSLGSFLDRLEAVESGGNPLAKASTSSATGPYQFTAGTWNGLVDELGLDYTLADRTDPVKAKQVVEHLTRKNIQKATKDLERSPSNVELYMYHFLGNAKKFLTAPPDGLAKDFVRPSQASANKNVFFDKEGNPKTVKDVLDRFRRKFE